MTKVKYKNKYYKTSKLPPGTMSYKGNKALPTTDIEITNYSEVDYRTFITNAVQDTFNFKDNRHVTWININGLNNIKEIETLGRHYDLHPLTLEDIVNTNQRPKLEEFDHYMFVVIKMLFITNDDEIHYEHLSLVLGEHYVLTFQEAESNLFNGLRERLKSAKGRIRNHGSDYLMFTILDVVVDNYFMVIDVLGDKIEALEGSLFQFKEANDETLVQIQTLKQEILQMRRSIYPLREVVSSMEKADFPFIKEKTHRYLRDLYDHIIQVNESIDLYREMTRSLMDMYMTIISHKMNEIMKVLTIIATIFIPLTFIVGVYGMNFKYMPELNYNNSYFILLAAMFIMVICMLLYFRKKRWL